MTAEMRVEKRQQHEGIMRRFCLSAIVLVLLSVSILCLAQESASPPRPKLPDVVLFESAIGDVHFPHKMHQKMSCKRCHHQIHARELATPHDEYFAASWIKCQSCHEDDSEFGDTYFKCSGCHHAEPESIVDETISSKVVIHQSCWKCHKSGTGVTASEGCSYCHEQEQ